MSGWIDVHADGQKISEQMDGQTPRGNMIRSFFKWVHKYHLVAEFYKTGYLGSTMEKHHCTAKYNMLNKLLTQLKFHFLFISL